MKKADAIAFSKLKEYLLKNKISNSYDGLMEPFHITADIAKTSRNSESNEYSLKVIRLLRVVPYRRLVFLAELEDKTKVVLKLFIDRAKYIKDYAAVQHGHNLLSSVRLNAPDVISSKIDSNNKLSYIISCYIKDNFNDNECSADIKHKKYIQAIACLHKNKLYQKDLHLNNFIINNDQVYYLDSESLVQYGLLKSNNVNVNHIFNKTILGNFALFLAQLDIKYHDHWLEYINYYINYYISLYDIDYDIKNKEQKIIDYIYSEAMIKLDVRLKKLANKCQRNCSDIKIINKPDSFHGIYKRHYYNKYSNFFNELIADHQSTVRKYHFKTLKKGSKAHVYLLDYKNQKFVIKYYLSKNKASQFINTLKHLFIRPRCLNSWLKANILEHAGILTPSPVASIILKDKLLTKQSFYIMEYSSDYQRLDTVTSFSEIKLYITKINTLLKSLKLLKLAHRDFKTVNIGFSNDSPLILDLDSMTKYNNNYLLNKYHNKDINRLLRCWQSYPEILKLFRSELCIVTKK